MYLTIVFSAINHAGCDERECVYLTIVFLAINHAGCDERECVSNDCVFSYKSRGV